jgi:hypothetical protein
MEAASHSSALGAPVQPAAPPPRRDEIRRRPKWKQWKPQRSKRDEESRTCARLNGSEDELLLVPWPMVAYRMSQLLGKPVTPQQCRGLHGHAIRKLRAALARSQR